MRTPSVEQNHLLDDSFPRMFLLGLVTAGVITGYAGAEDRSLSTKVATDILEFVLKRGELKKDTSIASDILGFVAGGTEDKVLNYVFERDDLPNENSSVWLY